MVGPITPNPIKIELEDTNIIATSSQAQNSPQDVLSSDYFKLISRNRRLNKEQQFHTLGFNSQLNKDASLGKIESIIHAGQQSSLIRSLTDATQEIFSGHTNDVYDVRNITINFNDDISDYNQATATYQAILNQGTPTPAQTAAFNAARAAFELAVIAYNSNPAIMAARLAQASYANLAQAYNDNVTLIKNNQELYNKIREAAGLSTLPPAFFNQLTFASLIDPNLDPNNPTPAILSQYVLPSSQPPFSPLPPLVIPLAQPLNIFGLVPNPFTQTEIQKALDTIVGIPTASLELVDSLNYIEQKIIDLLYYGGEIDLPFTYIEQFFSYLANAASAVSNKTDIGLMVLSLSNSFFADILDRVVYQEVMAKMQLDAFPPLNDQLEAFSLHLIKKAAEFTAKNPSLQNLVQNSEVPQPVLEIQSALAFANVIRDLILSGAPKTGVTQIINGNPDFSKLPANTKLELAAAFSAVLSITLLQLALSEIAQALKSPGLIPQLLANTPALSPFISDGTPSQIPDFKFVFKNPLSQIFLKINLIKASNNLLAPSSKDAAPPNIPDLSPKISEAIDAVISKLDTINNEEELKAALTEAFSKKGIVEAAALAETALALIKAETKLPELDQKFKPELLSLILPFLTPAPVLTSAPASSALQSQKQTPQTSQSPAPSTPTPVASSTPTTGPTPSTVSQTLKQTPQAPAGSIPSPVASSTPTTGPTPSTVSQTLKQTPQAPAGSIPSPTSSPDAAATASSAQAPSPTQRPTGTLGPLNPVFASAAANVLTSQVTATPESDPIFLPKVLRALIPHAFTPAPISSPITSLTNGRPTIPRQTLANTLAGLLTDLAPQLFNPITAEQASLTEERIPVTDQGVPFTPEQVPFTGQRVSPTPEQTRLTKERIPVTDQGVPFTPQQVPFTGQRVSSTPEQTRLTEKRIPVTDQGVPFTPEQVPFTGQRVSSTPEQTHLTEERIPVTDQGVPFTPQQVPFTGQRVSSTPEQTRLTEKRIPVTDQGVPFTPEQVPFTGQRVSSTPEQTHLTEERIPVTAQGVPFTAGQVPFTAVRIPVTPKELIGRAINTVLKEGSFYNASFFVKAFDIALSEAAQGSIPRVPLSRSVQRRVSEAALDYVNALQVPVEGSPVIRPNQRVLIDRLSNILLESLPENHTLNTAGDKKQAAVALSTQILNKALQTQGILNNEAAALSGILRISIVLGIPKEVAIALATETVGFINTANKTSPDIGVPTSRLPDYLNSIFPVGTLARKQALELLADGLKNQEIRDALFKTLSNASALTSNRAFFSQLFLELLAEGQVEGLPVIDLSSAKAAKAVEAADIAGRFTKFLESEPPDPAKNPLLAVGLNARVLTRAALSEEISNAAVGLVSPYMDPYQAQEYPITVTRTAFNVSSGINEQLIILKDLDQTNAIRTQRNEAAQLGPNNLSQFVLHAYVSIMMMVSMSPIAQADLRTSDTSKEPITFDKNPRI